MTRSLALILLFAGGCASTVRFADRQILWSDPDTAPIEQPKKRKVLDNWGRLRAGVLEPVDGVLALGARKEAQNVNALDEVPDSSWFSDPRRQAEVQGLVFGPAQVGAEPQERPDLDGPITVVSGKVQGASRGFVVKDRRGHKFLLKLDAPGYFALSTSTEVVAARLVAAAGWRVPAISLIEIEPTKLEISPSAELRGSGGARALTDADLRRILSGVPRAPDGRYRFSASAWIEGEVVGPYSYVGKRPDDPNDRVPHEDRRELRGYRVFSSWINNVDTIEANTLDTYVGAPGRGHLVHYQQDVGGSFGNYAVGPLQSWMGTESYVDGTRIIGAIFAFGGYTRSWSRADIERERAMTIEAWPELGWFESRHFDPKHWSPLWSNPAFERATSRDLYWGAKRVLAISRAELEAAIAAGRYRPEAAKRLFDVLWERREKIGRAYLSLVAPLERFGFDGESLCFDDLVVEHGLDERAAIYEVRGAGPAMPTARARLCTALPRGEGYHIVAIRVRRGDARYSPFLRVHYVEDHGQRRVVGLER